MKVAMIDLLAQTPFYDYYLAESMTSLVGQLTLYTTRFHLEPDYFASAPFVWTPGFADRLGLAFSRISLLRRPIRLAEYYLNWRTLLRRFQSQPPDIVHIQWLPLLGAVPVLSEMRFVRHLQLHRIPVIYTMHNYLPHDATSAMSTAYHRLYSSMDHLIVHTQTDLQRLLKDGVLAKRINVVPHGPVFADEQIVPAVQARELLGMDQNEFILLMLGVIRPYKGIEETINALAQVADAHPAIRLWIVGNALDRKYVSSLQRLAANLNLQRYLEWRVGYVHSSQVRLLHAAADVVLFPYRNISQSGAFLTAAGLGKCTLSTPVGGIGEMVRDGENGIQVATAQPEAIAEGLRRCLDFTPEQRNAMGLRLRQETAQTCSWEQIARQTVAIYEKALNRC